MNKGCGLRATRAIALAAGFTAAVSVGSACAQIIVSPPAGKEPVRVGAVLSLTGPLSTAGIPEREGILLAQRVVNNTGGIGGRPLQVVIEDDASNAETAVAKLG